MRRILIAPDLITLASEYAIRMETGRDFNRGNNPKNKLQNLYIALGKSSSKIKELITPKTKGHSAKYNIYFGNKYSAPSEYVKAIYDNYDGLNNLLPSRFDVCLSSVFNPIIPSDKIRKYMVKMPKKQWQPLYEMIVDAMGYGKVQKEIFPEYIRRLDIKTCVYCNAQFATTATIQSVKTYKKGFSKITEEACSCYELDHNKPKSEFPFLCTNFFNLQPCCSSCNRKKNDRSLEYSLYYECGDSNSRPLHFVLKKEDILNFRMSNVCKGLVPWLCNNGQDTPPSLLDNHTIAGEFNEKLGIQDIYKEHTDVVEELLWNHKIYSSGFVSALNNQLPQLGLTGFDLKRFILGGFYTNENDFLKRPLSVMKEDIWEQLNNVIP